MRCQCLWGGVRLDKIDGFSGLESLAVLYHRGNFGRFDHLVALCFPLCTSQLVDAAQIDVTRYIVWGLGVMVGYSRAIISQFWPFAVFSRMKYPLKKPLRR